jgi:hypothetical protein
MHEVPGGTAASGDLVFGERSRPESISMVTPPIPSPLSRACPQPMTPAAAPGYARADH